MDVLRFYRLRSGLILPRMEPLKRPDPPYGATEYAESSDGPYLPLGGKWALDGKRMTWRWGK